MAPGFLAVLSEPGNQVSLNEFHDWYDNEHIPLRLNHLPSFLSGARYHQSIGKKPSWIAVYDIDDTKTFKDPSYTVLREKRSKREEDLIGRLEVLDRRTCEFVREVGHGETRTTGLRVGNPSRWVVTHGIGTNNTIGGPRIDDDEGDEFKEVLIWLYDVEKKLKDSAVGGWVKTRVFKVLESAKTGMNVREEEEEEQSVLSYFVFHGKIFSSVKPSTGN
jgi:hypothetical protein